MEKHTEGGHGAPNCIILSDPFGLWKADWYKHWVADDSKKMAADNYVAEAALLE